MPTLADSGAGIPGFLSPLGPSGFRIGRIQKDAFPFLNRALDAELPFHSLSSRMAKTHPEFGIPGKPRETLAPLLAGIGHEAVHAIPNHRLHGTAPAR